MENNFQDNLKDLCREFLGNYEEFKELEARIKQVRQMMGMQKDEIIGEFDSIGIKSLDIDGVKLVKYQATHPIVKDFDALKNHIKNEWGEPLEEYMKETFDAKKLKELTDTLKKQSINQNVPLESLMPSGLEVSVTTSVQVRGFNNHDNKEDTT